MKWRAHVQSVLVFLLVAVSAAGFSGCQEPDVQTEPAVVIHTPLMHIDRLEFAEELDLKRAAYPYNIDENPAEYNEMVIRLVEMLSEELVLLTAALGKGVSVTDHDVDLAEAEFKSDYPEDSFEKMLLENAVPYTLWKKRFKREMIMVKLVEKELTGKIEITPQDLVRYYDELKKSDPDQLQDTSETVLVDRLRLKKTQEQYDQWIEELWAQYPVEINKDVLKTFLIADEMIRGRKNEAND